MASKESTVQILTEYPDKIAFAYLRWKARESKTRQLEAKKYMSLKAEAADKKVTEAHLGRCLDEDKEVYKARLRVILAESRHMRLYEKLMSAKKLSDIRTAY